MRKIVLQNKATFIVFLVKPCCYHEMSVYNNLFFGSFPGSNLIAGDEIPICENAYEYDLSTLYST